jgi:hypothetical protein
MAPDLSLLTDARMPSFEMLTFFLMKIDLSYPTETTLAIFTIKIAWSCLRGRMSLRHNQSFGPNLSKFLPER